MANRDWIGRGIAFGLGIGALVLWQALSGPSNFQECVLESAKSGGGDLAIKLAAVDCAQRFDPNPKE